MVTVHIAFSDRQYSMQHVYCDKDSIIPCINHKISFVQNRHTITYPMNHRARTRTKMCITTAAAEEAWWS